jgi:hypothetical protein
MTRKLPIPPIIYERNVEKFVTVPCDYSEAGSARCSTFDKGKVLIYGDMPIPPRSFQCPKCNGTGMIQVSEKQLNEEISELLRERQVVNNEISRLRALLKTAK